MRNHTELLQTLKYYQLLVFLLEVQFSNYQRHQVFLKCISLLKKRIIHYPSQFVYLNFNPKINDKVMNNKFSYL